MCVGMGGGVGDKLGVGRGVGGGVFDKMWVGMGIGKAPGWALRSIITSHVESLSHLSKDYGIKQFLK